MVKKALICHKPERIPEFIDFAFRTAGSGRPGPVYLELPVDVLNATVSPDGIKKLHTVIQSHPVDLDKVEQILPMLEKATQPVIIAGSGAWYADGGSELAEFVESTGIPVFTSPTRIRYVLNLHLPSDPVRRWLPIPGPIWCCFWAPG
jgi:acetolactate synthase-1/2/3 large subunit